MTHQGYAKPDGPLLAKPRQRLTDKSEFLLNLEAKQALWNRLRVDANASRSNRVQWIRRKEQR